jgi:hypothetical protein
LKEILTINGVEIINAIFGKLLRHSFHDSSNFLGGDPLKAQKPRPLLRDSYEGGDLSASFARNPTFVQERAVEEEEEKESDSQE